MSSAASKSKKICDMMFSVTWYQKNINRRHHATGFHVVSLQNSSGIDAQCSQQAVKT
jgi:hypothetical protein